MNKESILVGVIGILGGSLLTLAVASIFVNTNNSFMMNAIGMHPNNSVTIGNSMDMDTMTNNLSGKTGDNFDRAFLAEMIVHHQGAIDMASIANQNAKHDEIKKLADDIVIAQTKEITHMKQWQQQWSYSTSPQPYNDGMMHSSH